MDRRVTIVSRTRVSDNTGGFDFAETVQENVLCKRAPNLAGNVENQMGGQLFSGLQWVFTFPLGTAVKNDDEIIDGDERFSVLGVTFPETFATAHRVFAIEK